MDSVDVKTSEHTVMKQYALQISKKVKYYWK